MTQPTSLRAYAKLRGVSVEAVSKAIESGRLRESVVTVDGQPKIADTALADQEWEANTRPRIDHPERALSAAGATSVANTTSERSDSDEPSYNKSRALREAAAARREAALAEMAEIDLAERKGELVSVEEARADVVDKFTLVKTRLLGVPSRLAQRLPKLAAEVVPVLDTILREALDELAIEE